MKIHQLFETVSSTYTYLLIDEATKEAAIIDPVQETVGRDLKLLEELGLQLKYVLETHVHADHITGAAQLREKTGAKIAVGKAAGVVCGDQGLVDGDELFLGKKKIKILATPGHTDACVTYYLESTPEKPGVAFTGDTLLIRGCGRTDFQNGSAESLFESVRNKLFTLPDNTVVYPGHDYRGLTSTTIGVEKKHNPRLGIGNTKEVFKKIMSELKLAFPKKIKEAVPANLNCGQRLDTDQGEEGRFFSPHLADGIPEVSCEDVSRHIGQAKAGKVLYIDVRTQDEFTGELGHIPGSKLMTLGAPLQEFLEAGDRDQEIIFICRSGGRSGSATSESLKMGYKKTANMVGGMIGWNAKKLQKETGEVR